MNRFRLLRHLRGLFHRQGTETAQVLGGVDGIVVELPLPCPNAGSPAEATVTHGGAGIPIRLLIEEHLEPVGLPVHLHLAAIEGPALILRFRFPGQLLDAGLGLPDHGAVIGQGVAFIRFGIGLPVP